jgi:Tol biopolymer transport system component
MREWTIAIDTRRAHRVGRVAGFAAAALAGAMLAMLPVQVEGQYFGRNKVLWDQFEFEVLETDHFLIHHYPPSAESADYVARLAERWYHRLSTFFDHEFDEKKTLIIYQDHADFQQTTVTSGLIGEGTGGFAESLQDRIVLPLTGINADNDHVIGHEIVHVFQFDMARRARSEGQQVQLFRLPLWMVEGLAEYLSEGRDDAATAMHMRDAVLHDMLPRRGRGGSRRGVSPYHYGQAFYAYIGGRWDDDTVRNFFRQASLAGPDSAFRQVLGMSADEFLEEFNAAMEEAYRPVLDGRRNASEQADPFLTSQTTRGAINLAPSLSPDGRWVAFLSTRDLAIELFLADTRTGRIERRLLRSEADSHFDNLSFLDSSVGWSPDGRRFAFSVFARGERRIAIYDMERRRVERRLDLEGIKGMRHATWTPDGQSLVFSAIVHGASDLYSYDLATGRVQRLTDDRYTALQPVVSPDGTQIAFVTDRGPATDLQRLQFGDMQIALLDVESGNITVLPLFERGKHIDPHFSADGGSLYFVAEPDGVSDVFRHDLRSGVTYRLTAVQTGVSGITARSPTLSVAGPDDMVVFSVLEEGRWNVYRASDNIGEPVEAPGPALAAQLPPIRDEAAAPDLVQLYLDNPMAGLAGPGRPYPREPYQPRFRLSSVGPATIGVGSDRFGVGVSGAFSMLFSDALNERLIAAAISGGSTQGVLGIEDTMGAEVIYLNQSRRLQWGGRVSRIPYLASATFVSRRPVEVDGTVVPADVIERFYDVQRVSTAGMFAQYPLSLNNRVEVSAGIAGIGFKREVERFVYPSGFPAYYESQRLPSPAGVDLQQAAIAFVRDTSQFGIASPIRGTRFRAETEWTSGDLSFETALLDYRRYFFVRPVTFAMRALHVGRRGRGSEDFRVPILDIGDQNLVRGYELGSIGVQECTLSADATRCPEFERLIGSRIAVMNFEVRAQILGTPDFGLLSLPAAPTEAVFFVDVGAAWNAGDSVDWRFDRNTPDRVPVVSAGLAARTVLFGMLPLEFYYAYPFQRPQKDWVSGFRIGIGW